MDLTIKRESFGQDDQSWLGSAHGTSAAQSITLDVSTFTAEEHYPEGWLKSGLPLANSGETYVLWTTEADLAGFLFTTVRVPVDTATPVGAAILEHGRVKTAKLPVSVDTAGQATAAGRIIFA
ncbi:head decoration protein [Glutamicibacter ardleyensis]|uniref:head decoration protein n=1 Tax=Glutamicibacter ardleyensis TaxID=225894 RepID=UPI003FD20E64